ncbi:hypothetical protein [Actinomadura rupiterrae]|uniref:hypothetical protein n=1 Tax=Actinomadura rupiterrae TaxID=559627 RepID=UPI0020A2ADC7|nr:hypothetical protein [Actinomadura rupiterrae]MCP2342743.1 hypothetical protein [Actinomadura rupiterrae]
MTVFCLGGIAAAVADLAGPASTASADAVVLVLCASGLLVFVPTSLLTWLDIRMGGRVE